MDESFTAHGLEDREGMIYVIGVPDDAPERVHKWMSDEFQQSWGEKFDHAECVIVPEEIDVAAIYEPECEVEVHVEDGEVVIERSEEEQVTFAPEEQVTFVPEEDESQETLIQYDDGTDSAEQIDYLEYEREHSWSLDIGDMDKAWIEKAFEEGGDDDEDEDGEPETFEEQLERAREEAKRREEVYGRSPVDELREIKEDIEAVKEMQDGQYRQSWIEEWGEGVDIDAEEIVEMEELDEEMEEVEWGGDGPAPNVEPDSTSGDVTFDEQTVPYYVDVEWTIESDEALVIEVECRYCGAETCLVGSEAQEVHDRPWVVLEHKPSCDV